MRRSVVLSRPDYIGLPNHVLAMILACDGLLACTVLIVTSDAHPGTMLVTFARF